MKKINKHAFLTFGILAGLILGAVVGQIVFTTMEDAARSAWASNFKFLGDTFFIRLLKMLLVPLVASSVLVGVTSIGDPTKLGKVGGFTIFYYFSTMLIAVIVGAVLVTAIAPGEGMDQSVLDQGAAAYESGDQARNQRMATKGEQGLVGAFKNIVSQLIPDNPVGAAAEGKLLPVISFSLMLGVVLMLIGEQGKPVIRFMESLFAAMMKLVDLILYLAPAGVFFLVAYTVAELGAARLLKPMIGYMITVVSGLAIHAFIVLPLILWLFARTNPFRFMHQMREALMTAFGTDSSSATLPVTMETAEKVGGVSKKSAGFVLPLGATINMDGTALYEAVAVIFLFQCFGIELGMTEVAIVAVTATLAAVGAAGIPSAGLVTMAIVVMAVNNSLGEGKTLPMQAVGLILGVDRILDMCRTTVNVWGDAVGAKIMTRFLPDEEETNTQSQLHSDQTKASRASADTPGYEIKTEDTA